MSRGKQASPGLDIEKRVVAHARQLKKIEVKQLNSLLNHFHANCDS